MTTENLTPITKTDQPTSHVRVGRSYVTRGADVVTVRHRGREVFFRVETEDDRVMSSIGNKAYIHENAGALFGGIDRTVENRFVVDSTASLHAVRECERATIYVEDVSPSALESHLRKESYLLHPIDEVTRLGDRLVEFSVVDLEPAEYATVRVTEETTLEFTDERPAESATSRLAGRGGATGTESSTDHGPGSGAAPGQGHEVGTADDEPTISVEPTVPEVSFEEDVAGLTDVKETARMLLALFDPSVEAEIVERYGREFADRGGSMLLYGPPGCGKTHVSEAIANEASEVLERRDVNFLEVRGSDIQSKYAGESEKNVAAVFDRAHELSQDGFVVLFFDEIETLVPDRSDDNLQRHERALTNAFLQAMNDVEDNLFVIGATNMPFAVDPAAARRFPIQQFIPQPDEEVMSEVWAKQLSSLPHQKDLDFERLGSASVGYTPAEIADRVLGNSLQRELVRGILEGEPVDVSTTYLVERLESEEPKTISQYVTSVRTQLDELEGYPELRRYVESQADRLGIGTQTASGPLSSLLEAAEVDQRAQGDDRERGGDSDGERTNRDEDTEETADSGAEPPTRS